jgi:hypothetical protein
MNPELALKLVKINPYHGRPPADAYEMASLAVLADLTDRRGIKHELENIDDEVRQEIVASLTAIICAAVSGDAT